MITISANVLVRNELKHIDGFVKNMLDSKIDEIIFLDGGSTDGTYERLLEYKVKYPHIHVLLWEQPINSDFKKGFNEVARRNLMIEASSMNWCLYIDIDERISVNFKSKLDAIQMDKADFIVFSLYHFWGDGIRVSIQDDKVWCPDLKYRLFKRTKNIRFGSNDVNGLHNFLMYKKKRIMGGFNKGKVVSNIIALYNKSFFMKGVRIFTNNKLQIFHLHYYDLNTPKINDLRKEDFNFKIVEVNSVEEGLHYRRLDKVIPRISIDSVNDARFIINNYLNDICLHSHSQR